MPDPVAACLAVAMAFQQGVEARQEGRLGDALEHFSTVISATPDAPGFRDAARIERARTFFALRLPDRARLDLRDVHDASESAALRELSLHVLVEIGGTPSEWLPPESPVEGLARRLGVSTNGWAVVDCGIATNRLTATLTVADGQRTLVAALEARRGQWTMRTLVHSGRVEGARPSPPDPRLFIPPRGEAAEELPLLSLALLAHAQSGANLLPASLRDLDPASPALAARHLWSPPGALPLPYLFRARMPVTPDTDSATLIAATPAPLLGQREAVDLAGRVSLLSEAAFRTAAWNQGWRDPGLVPKEEIAPGIQHEIKTLAAALVGGDPASRRDATARLAALGVQAHPWLCEWLDHPDPEVRSAAARILNFPVPP